MLTALDQVANQNHLQLVKAVLPYVQPGSQRMLSVFIKMLELQNILRFYDRGDRCVSACSISGDSPGILEILSDIRNYCDGSEQEMIDQCLQLMAVMELYSVFSEQDGAEDKPSAEPEVNNGRQEEGENYE